MDQDNDKENEVGRRMYGKAETTMRATTTPPPQTAATKRKGAMPKKTWDDTNTANEGADDDDDDGNRTTGTTQHPPLRATARRVERGARMDNYETSRPQDDQGTRDSNNGRQRGATPNRWRVETGTGTTIGTGPTQPGRCTRMVEAASPSPTFYVDRFFFIFVFN